MTRNTKSKLQKLNDNENNLEKLDKIKQYTHKENSHMVTVRIIQVRRVWSEILELMNG